MLKDTIDTDDCHEKVRFGCTVPNHVRTVDDINADIMLWLIESLGCQLERNIVLGSVFI